MTRAKLHKKKLSPIISLMGPTAIGKTDLALKLVADLPLEIISVDSAMIYQGMDIGTGKPNKKILATVPHHLIDILDPSEHYSAAQFRQDALKICQNILARGKIPFLVGGTMLYFKALKYGLAKLPGADTSVREQLAIEAKHQGLAAMHARLAMIDPKAARRIHQHDPQRLSRALEVYQLTGKTLTEHLQHQQAENLPYHFLELALLPANRLSLHERSAARFQKMLAEGLLGEVSALKQRSDLTIDMPALRCVGYRQIWQYLDNQISYEEMVTKANAATRQLAKRQLTWLRSWSDIKTFMDNNMDLYASVYHCINEYS